jgi:hypothetical protein
MSRCNGCFLITAAMLALWGCGGSNIQTPSQPQIADANGLPATSRLLTVQQAAPPSSNITVQRTNRPHRSPSVPAGTIAVTVDVLQNRHAISPLVYGVNFPPDTNYISDSGATFVRWGGNASTRYNWKNFNTNAAADWYFSNRPMDSNPLYQHSTNFVSSIAGAGAYPIMTIGLLPWVAKDATSASFSVAKYGAQCAVNPFNSDQGNGVQTDCSTNITDNDASDAHVPLLDLPAAGDPADAIYRNQWVAALAPNFGSGAHFYNMDNEMDIWAGTHRDVHPTPVNYNEIRGTFLKEAKPIKAWDPNAVLFAPVSCCWWFYWNSAAGDGDKTANASIDFLPWWLNEVAISDRVEGFRSLDVFDVHAYTDSPDTSTYTLPQKQALTLRITRDWWDSTYTSESSAINQDWATQIQPLKKIPFRIPRLRAMLNSIYPGTPMAITEWNEGATVWGSSAEADFTTALADADAYGILARERVYAAARWTAPANNVPAYEALKLFRNYDGAHHTFASISVGATHSADPSVFSSYAAMDPNGTRLTILLINKDPAVTVPAEVTLPNFSPTTVTAYTLSSTNSQTITTSGAQAWPDYWNLPPYSATLLVVTGQPTFSPTVEWELNPDTVMIPANGTFDLHPQITSGSGTVSLIGVQADSGISLNATQPTATVIQNGTVTVNAGSTPGFYHFSVTGQDNSGVQQVQGGWIVVGNPAATLAKIGDNQTGAPGSAITLTVTFDPAQSGGTGEGASILFTTDAGNIPNRIARTSANQASVQLTLPNTPGTVHVTAEGPIPLGHPVVTFTATAQ